jgi:hypothetical protein
MKKKYIVLSPIVASIIFVAALSFDRQKEYKRNAGLVTQLQSSMTNDLFSIVIAPYQLSHEKWKVEVSEKEELAAFRKAVTLADTRPVSGHSGPIGEWTLTLRDVAGVQHSYLASVHEYEPTDLFVTDEFYIQTKPGVYSRGKPRRARLPGMGSWMMKRAPDGRL